MVDNVLVGGMVPSLEHSDVYVNEDNVLITISANHRSTSFRMILQSSLGHEFVIGEEELAIDFLESHAPWHSLKVSDRPLNPKFKKGATGKILPDFSNIAPGSRLDLIYNGELVKDCFVLHSHMSGDNYLDIKVAGEWMDLRDVVGCEFTVALEGKEFPSSNGGYFLAPSKELLYFEFASDGSLIASTSLANSIPDLESLNRILLDYSTWDTMDFA